MKKMCIHSEVAGYEAGKVKENLWFVSYIIKLEKKMHTLSAVTVHDK